MGVVYEVCRNHLAVDKSHRKDGNAFMKAVRWTIFMLPLLTPASLGAEPFQHHDGNTQRLGIVVFPTSCSPAVQTDFQRGVALLHSFAYEDATATFIEIEKRDTACGMAYWGEAMSYYHQIWEPPDAAHLDKGRESSEKATGAGAKTQRERDYIAAIAAFYDSSVHVDHVTRALKYQAAMEHIYKNYPEDREAAVFYALSLIASASTHDPGYTDKRKAGEILEKVFAEQPEHPGVAHYIIHAYDNPVLAPHALNAARRYAQIAPASVHALHMPSHIFIQVGSWQEAIDSNLASIAAAREYSAKHHLKGIWDMEAHAQDYLAYAYVQTGRDKDPKRVLDEVRAAHDERVGESPVGSYSAFAGIPARYALERKQWAEACVLADHNLPHPIYEAETYFARTLGCARSGKLQAARENLNHLAKLQNSPKVDESSYTDANFIEIQKREASAWLALAEKNTDEAVRLMRSAVDLEQSTLATWVPAPILPANEQLGDLLLELNRPPEALEAFEASMTVTPNRFNGLYGAGHAAELGGNLEKTKTYYEKLNDNCKDADTDRPELAAAKAFLLRQMTPLGR
jgi:tetratricopeptide (TPR) repeat protein